MMWLLSSGVEATAEWAVAHQEEGSRAKRTLEQEDDTIRSEADRAAAAAAQQTASTPASEPTTPKG